MSPPSFECSNEAFSSIKSLTNATRGNQVFFHVCWKQGPCLLGASIVATFIWSICGYFRSFLSSNISCPSWSKHLHKPTDAELELHLRIDLQNPKSPRGPLVRDLHPWIVNSDFAVSAMPEPIHSCYPSCWCWWSRDLLIISWEQMSPTLYQAVSWRLQPAFLISSISPIVTWASQL